MVGPAYEKSKPIKIKGPILYLLSPNLGQISVGPTVKLNLIKICDFPNLMVGTTHVGVTLGETP